MKKNHAPVNSLKNSANRILKRPFKRLSHNKLCLNTAFVLSAVFFFTACTPKGEEKKGPKTVSSTVAPQRTVAAIVEGDTIFLETVDELAKKELYEVRSEVLFDQVTQTILNKEAKAKGISNEALIANEITAKLQPVSEQAIVGYMREGYGFSGKVDPNSKLYRESKEFLENEQFEKAQAAYIKDLVATKTDIRILLKDPVSTETVDLREMVSYSRGNRASPIKVVVVSDYRCESCRKVHEALEPLYAKYEHAVEFYAVLFTESMTFAERASMAAGEQGKFWEMHDLLFKNQDVLNDTMIRGFAVQLGLDMEIFDMDAESDAVVNIINSNIEMLRSNGIVGVPTIIINDKLVPQGYGVPHIEAILKRMVAKTQ